MSKTDVLNRFASDPEERLMLARVLDKLDVARNRNIPGITQFLSMGQRKAVEEMLTSQGHPPHFFWGGYPEAERTVCIFLPDWMDRDDWFASEELAVGAVKLGFPRDCDLTHRDFLGSIMGLGITREKIGDLLVEQTSCCVVLLKDVEHVLMTQLDQVGRQKVKVSTFPWQDLRPGETTIQLKNDTVATLRFDAVAASAFSTSRSKIGSAIGSKKVQLNGKDCDKVDKLLEEGDVLVWRGHGKCVLKEVNGHSRKGRVMIVIERYV